jgi:thiol-disulfide isomerase/thioredoxin
MPSLLSRIPERFRTSYYVLNALLPVCYVLLRAKRLDPGELATKDPLGLTREGQVYFSLALLLGVRTLSSPTLDAYLASAFMFTRAAVLLLLWFMDTRMCGLFAALWLLVFVVYPQPRFKHPSSVLVLNNVTFDQRVTKSTAKTINVIWFHATWSSRCTQLAPVLATAAQKYAHVRVRFSKIDLSRWPQMAERYNISMTASSQQLPTVICFKQGIETARIPTLQDIQDAPNQWRRGFTAAHIADKLDLDVRLKDAVQWETEAQQRFQEASHNGTAKKSQ